MFKDVLLVSKANIETNLLERFLQSFFDIYVQIFSSETFYYTSCNIGVLVFKLLH